MCACEEGHMSTVQLLLACGANKELLNNAGETALALASSQEIKDVLK